MDTGILHKGGAIDYIWQYSKYRGNLFFECEKIYESGNGLAALILLLNLIENVFKDVLNDYDSKFFDIIKELKRRDYITEIESNFLNNEKTGVRKIRNMLAHSNAAKYNMVYLENGKEVLYPFTEPEACLKLYDKFSVVLLNISLRLTSIHFLDPISVNLDNYISQIKLVIKEISPEEIMKFKGLESLINSEWKRLDESVKYRLAENSSDANVMKHIFQHIFKDANIT